MIHDCSPQIFQLFLNYVYSGKLENEENSGMAATSSMSGNVVLVLDTLSDLIALADRYIPTRVNAKDAKFFLI